MPQYSARDAAPRHRYHRIRQRIQEAAEFLDVDRYASCKHEMRGLVQR
jgi:hypothetical protein